MSQSSGNSPIDRVVAWFKGLFGSGQSATTGQPTTTTLSSTDSTATTRSATEPVATTLSATDATTTTPSSSTTQQVDRANDAMRDRARDLVQPLDDEAAAAASTAATAASEAPDTVAAARDAAASETSDAVSSARTTAASTQARVDEINTDLREKARNLVRPLESDTDLSATSDLPGDVGETATSAAAGQPTGASSDEFAAGGYTPDPVTATDVERAADGDGSLADSASAASDVDETAAAAVEDERGSVGVVDATPGSGPTAAEEARIDTVGEGTYAATAGDFVTGGPSSEDDLGLVDDGDLDATERGALENAEDAQLTHLPGRDRPVFGTRTGADFSRTGFHAGMRGDEADAFTAGDTDAPTGYATTSDAATSGGATASTDAAPTGDSDTQAIGESSGDAGSSAEPSANADWTTTSSSDAQAADDSSTIPDSSASGNSPETGWDTATSESSASATSGMATDGDSAGSAGSSGVDGDDAAIVDAPEETGQDVDLSRAGFHADDTGEEGPGNTEMTAGDDYSAARSAEELPGVAQVSTAAADTGQEMASGQESGDLVGGEPVSDPPAGVAVAAEPTDEVSAGSAGYAGAVPGDGTANTPAGYPVKGNGSSMIYHTTEMSSYALTKPEWCFATAEDAEQAGFRPPRRYQNQG